MDVYSRYAHDTKKSINSLWVEAKKHYRQGTAEPGLKELVVE